MRKIRKNSWHFACFNAWWSFGSREPKGYLEECIRDGMRVGICEYARGVVFGLVFILPLNVYSIAMTWLFGNRRTEPFMTIERFPIERGHVLMALIYVATLAMPATREYAVALLGMGGLCVGGFLTFMVGCILIGAICYVIEHLFTTGFEAYVFTAECIRDTDVYALATGWYRSFRDNTCFPVAFVEDDQPVEGK